MVLLTSTLAPRWRRSGEGPRCRRGRLLGLDLAATGRCGEIVAALRLRLLIADRAADEVRYLCGSPDAEGNPAQIPVDLEPLIAADRLRIVPSSRLDMASLAEAGARLTDVDALAVALGRTLGIGLVSDDKKVRGAFAALCAGQALHSSLQLIRRATKMLRYKEPEIRDLLRSMRAGGNFEPPRLDPERDWFRHYLDQPEPLRATTRPARGRPGRGGA